MATISLFSAGGPVAKPSGFDSRRRFHGGLFLPWGRTHISGPPRGLRATHREAGRAHRRPPQGGHGDQGTLVMVVVLLLLPLLLLLLLLLGEVGAAAASQS